MNKVFIMAAIAVAAILYSSPAIAVGIDAHHANAIAANFMSKQKTTLKSSASSSQLTLCHTGYSSSDGVTPAYYVFAGEQDGWVVVAADDRATSVLGYAEHGTLDYDA